MKQFNMVRLSEMGVTIHQSSLDEETKNKILSTIRDIIRSERPVKSSMKLDLFSYVSKDGIHPPLVGVYHENGYKIASDAYILIKIKEEYPEYLEGRILLKNGEMLDNVSKYGQPINKYPDYNSVIQLTRDCSLGCRIDFDKFEELYESYKAKKKMKMDVMPYLELRIGDFKIVFIYESFYKFVKFMKSVGTDELKYNTPGRGVIVESGDNIGLLMPIYIENKNISDVLECEAV